jgi:hypothetical protein
MTRRQSVVLLLVCLASGMARAGAADITGAWTASFDTPVGEQTYKYDFVVKDAVLTGKAKSNLSESAILNGKVEGDQVTFGEILTFQGMEIKVQYTGKIVSADEIRFTRQVGDFGTEEFVAKRAKPEK